MVPWAKEMQKVVDGKLMEEVAAAADKSINIHWQREKKAFMFFHPSKRRVLVLVTCDKSGLVLMHIHSGHWRCCIPSSRTWTSNVRLKTPCRPSLLISDTSAGWNPVMLKAGPFPFLLFLPFFSTFPNVHNLLTLVTSRLMCLLPPPPPAPYTRTHFSVTPCLSIFFWGTCECPGLSVQRGPRHRCSKLFMNQSIVLHSRELNAWLTQQIPVCLLLYSVWFHCVDFAQQ